MKKNRKIILWTTSLFLLLILIIGYININKVEVPDDINTLDLSLTENKFYINDSNYKEDMDTIVEPYIQNYYKEGYFSSEEKISLYYESYILPNSKDTIVVSHGFTESTEKYDEVIYYFLKAGYSVYILDHRGHGNSTREVQDLSLVYVDDFNNYVSDFKDFMDKIVTVQSPNNSYYLFAHSMGGAIGATFLEDYPEYFKAAILSTPMLEINTGYPEIISKAISKIALLINKGDSYVFGHTAFDSNLNFDESASNSEIRYNYYFDKMLENENIQTYGASFSWLSASLKGVDKATDEDNLKKIKVPVLLFQAENDNLVLPNGHYIFNKEVENCDLILVKNSKHELYASNEDILIPYFNTIFNFLSTN